MAGWSTINDQVNLGLTALNGQKFIPNMAKYRAASNPNTYKDIPSLNKAVRAGLVDKQAGQKRLVQLLPKGPNIDTSLRTNLNPFNKQGVVYQQDVQGAKNLAVGTKNTFVGAYQQARKQAKYLSGSSSTQQQRNTIINNQKSLQKPFNPRANIINKSATKRQGVSQGNTAQGLIKAEKMAKQGKSPQQIQTFLTKDRQALAAQTGRGLNAIATISSFSVPGEGILAKTAGKAGLTDALSTAKDAATGALSKDQTIKDLLNRTRTQNLTNALERAKQGIKPPRSALDNHIVPNSPVGAVGKNESPQIANMVSNADVGKIPDKVAYDVPAYTKQVQQTLNNTTKATRAGNAGGAVKELQSIFTPGTGKAAMGIKNDFRAATGNLALNRSVQANSLRDTAKFFEHQKPGDNLNFIQRFESGVKQPTSQLEQHAATFKDWFNKDLGLARQIKPDTPELQNYFSHSGIWENPQAAKSFYNKFVTQSLGGKPNALEERQFPTIYDGIKAGLVPKESNPATLALNNRAQLLKAKMAQDFIDEQAKKGSDPELVQKIVDRYLQPGLNRSAIYRTAKQAAYGINNIQLGFSGFHVAGTGINAAVSRFANGVEDVLKLHPVKGTYKIVTSPAAPIKYIFQGNKMIKDVRSGKLSQDILNVAEGGGRVDRQVTYQTTGLSKSVSQLRSGSAKEMAKGTAMLPFRAISTSAKPVMEWWVPRIKAGATKELIDRKVAELGSKATQSELRAAKAEAINSIDNRFGQLVQDNLFWNKPTKDMMSIMMRSPGWNIGTVREIGGGATNLARPSVLKGLATGKGVPESTAYTLSLAATTMMIGTAMNYMFTGKAPQSPLDYFYPKTGKTDKNGNAERVSLPTYAKDVFAFSHNPAQTIKNKANPLIALGANLKSNTDYFGNEIRNPKDSAGTQVKQTGSFLAKNILPFTVTNSSQRVDKGKGTKAQSFFGITPAPGYITKSTFQQNVEAALNQALGTKRQTPEQADLSNKKSQARQDLAKGNTTLADQLLKSKQITPKQYSTLKETSKETSLARTFNYLESVDKKAAQQLYKTATPADRKKLGKINVAKLMK